METNRKSFHLSQVGHISQILVHPLKCGRGQEVDRVQCGPRGPWWATSPFLSSAFPSRLSGSGVRDREFMVVREREDEVMKAGDVVEQLKIYFL